MRENKNALLLTGVLSVAVFILFFVISVTEEQAGNLPGARGFLIAGTIAAVIACLCISFYFALSEPIRWASGKYNYGYYRRKKKAYKALQSARDNLVSEIAYRQVRDVERRAFVIDALYLGVDEEVAKLDFEEIAGKVRKRGTI